MKKITIIISVIVILAVVVPVAAKGQERVGEQINIMVGEPPTFTAGQPFHIAHGWTTGIVRGKPSDTPVRFSLARHYFELEVDGVIRDEDFVEQITGRNEEVLYHGRFWVHNFPDGMIAGTVVFTGRWFLACQIAVEENWYPGPCSNPNEPYEVASFQHTVEFIAP